MTSEWSGGSRAKAVVQARDPLAGHRLRCEVLVAPVRALSLLTVDRVLALGGQERLGLQVRPAG